MEFKQRKDFEKSAIVFYILFFKFILLFVLTLIKLSIFTVCSFRLTKNLRTDIFIFSYP